MKINLSELKQLVLDKYVVVQKHPEYDLYIYNYSQKTQYERYWTPLTLMCRGLILDGEGNIIARGFDKFFNYEELNETQIPKCGFKIYEKLDGSYINVFCFLGEIIVSSRGSFTSDHAIHAKQLIKTKYPKIQEFLGEGMTLICELITKWNRIVVDYGDRDELVLLGAYNFPLNCEDFDIETLGRWLGLRVARLFEYDDYKKIKSLITNNQEGFVVRFDNGFRMKIKGEEYVKLHRVVTQVSSKTVWKALMEGDESFQQLVEDTPDEFMDFVKEQVDKLERLHKNLYDQAVGVFKYLQATYNIEDRKIFATQASNYGKLSGLLFALYDSKDIDPIIWKRLEPEYEQPFKDKK